MLFVSFPQLQSFGNAEIGATGYEGKGLKGKRLAHSSIGEDDD
jgi:hypothetical protein